MCALTATTMMVQILFAKNVIIHVSPAALELARAVFPVLPHLTDSALLCQVVLVKMDTMT